MQPITIKNKGQGQIFKNSFIESLSRTKPIYIYSIYLPVIFAMLFYGHVYKGFSVVRELLLSLAGVLFWTLFEYAMHRFLFHIPAKSPRAKRFVYIMHGIHHEFPRDKSRLFMPVIPSLVLATIIFLLMYLLMGFNSLAVFPGFLSGYLLYGSMHYAIHAFPPPRFLKALWRNHSLHHYQTQDQGYGVSSVLWDVVFGTVPKQKDKQGRKEHDKTAELKRS